MQNTLSVRFFTVAVLIVFLYAAPAFAQIKGKPTAAEAAKFIEAAEARLAALSLKANQASWINSNFITYDTENLNAAVSDEFTAAITEFAVKSHRFDGLKLPYDVRRKINLLQNGIVIPAPKDDAERTELTKTAVSMESDYGRGKYCPPDEDGKCYSLGDFEKILAESRDPKELKKAWLGWHTVSPPYRTRYARFVELANKGAKELGYKDTGELWRSGYDMKPDEFSAEMERLWLQVKPLYDSLYVYTRAKLVKKYGASVVPPNGPIPAHLLGNMWSQEWTNIYPLLAPPSSSSGYDLTKILQDRKTDAKQMVHYGENFFVSLGMQKLPETFFERSLLTKPADRDVVCHASAWDLDAQQDVRIKMCIEINAIDFTTIHHELGHNYYQLAYASKPYLYQDSANDGFHEAIGDTIALSVTPEYLKQLQFIDKSPSAGADIALLMERALAKVSFLPFGYLVDKWRWDVFSGKTKPADYNKAWWDLRLQYQGIAPPEARSESDFDAGAKYHVASNTPYARYFLATILQYQFHRALCRQAGFTGPLHRCSIYGNKEVGANLQKMLAMGKSRPWPEALKALTGEDKMDATAIIDYYAPLKKWLDEQNRGLPPR
ncbi:MAG: M2 family metallopeptidase [Acidobacteria bacterium]|nr:M2 family metallopeptidase [Acidobacteriota bacterium]